jgi:pyocin large subunit-like protein
MRYGVTALSAALLLLTACDNGPSAVETRDRAGEAPASADQPSLTPTSVDDAEKPPITANRSETSNAKIERLFARNGAAFGARTAEDYLAKIDAFTRNPPAGTERVERANGDVLYYQASTNTFAVVAKDGTPRTMFKPDDAAAYWAEQKSRAPTFGQRRAADSDN